MSLRREKLDFLKLRPRFERAIFRRVAQCSVMTSLQQSIMNFGILLVQGLVNSFGVVAMAAFGAGVRIDAFGYLFLYYALYRGLGHFRTSIVLTVISLGIRVGLSYLLVWRGLGLHSIWWSIPIGWAAADLAGCARYRHLKRHGGFL